MKTLNAARQLVGMGLVGLALAGCAEIPKSTDAMLTYESTPAGATIFEGGQSLGAAPVTRTYKLAPNAATAQTPDVTAVWPSGARAQYFTVLPAGADRVATIARPASAPNLEMDLENAKRADAAKTRETQRQKEDTAREIARNSARCKEQQTKAMVAISDCS